MTKQVVLPESVNYHLNKNCNFRCTGCYAVFNDSPSMPGAMLPRGDMFRIVEAVAAAALPEGRSVRKLTFAGGEPTLCPWLHDLLAHAKSFGLATMLVTNGSRCTPSYLQSLAPALDWLTLSIDSLDAETNRTIGRHDQKRRSLDAAGYSEILDAASRLGIRTKINTVVNRINWREDIGDFIRESGISRWKILQVMEVKGQNDAAIDLLTISRAEFDAYIRRHQSVARAGIRVVPEPADTIRGSYCMIDPKGRFFDSTAGHHTYSVPILEAGIEAAFAGVSFDPTIFEARGGSYDFLGDTPASHDRPTLQPAPQQCSDS